jgi:hypothetical protein
VERLHFDVLADNRLMLGVLAKFGVPMDPISQGLTHGVIEVAPFVARLDTWPPAEALAVLAECVQEAHGNCRTP